MKPNKSTMAMAMLLGMMPFFPVNLRELSAPSVRHEWRKPKGRRTPKKRTFRLRHSIPKAFRQYAKRYGGLDVKMFCRFTERQHGGSNEQN